MKRGRRRERRRERGWEREKGGEVRRKRERGKREEGGELYMEWRKEIHWFIHKNSVATSTHR